MSEDLSDFKPLPRKSRRRRRRQLVGAVQPLSQGQVGRRARAAACSGLVQLFKLVGAAMLGLGLLIAGLNLARPAVRGSTEQGNVQAPPVVLPTIEFSLLRRATATPTDPPTATPVPMPDVAIIAGHWRAEAADGAPTVRDPGAICPDGLREVDINKGVADRMIPMLERRGYQVALLEEFDDRLKKVEPDFAPRVLLSIHVDSCISGPEYPYATGYKIAHAEPSANEVEDNRLVTCLRRAYDAVVSPYGLVFNHNTITRNMTEYHAFREIVNSTPAAIIELGFLGNDRTILTLRQDELARGLAIGLDDYLKGHPCAPTPVPATGEPESP